MRGKYARGSLADAARCAGDQHDFPLNVGHLNPGAVSRRLR
jgi:hypothetical protein